LVCVWYTRMQSYKSPSPLSNRNHLLEFIELERASLDVVHESSSEIALPPAGVTSSGSDDPGVMRLGVLTSSLDHARVNGGLGTVVLVNLVVDVANSLAVCDIGDNVTTDLGHSAHTSATSEEFVKLLIELTSVELIKFVFDGTLSATVAGGSSDKLGVVRLGVLTSSLNETGVDGGLDTIVLVDLVVDVADGLAVGDVRENITTDLGDSAHASATSHKLLESILELTFPVAVTDGSSNKLGVMRLGGEPGSLSETRMNGRLGTVVFVDLVVDITDSLAVGDVRSNISTDLGDSAHASTTSNELINGILEIALPPAGVTSSGSNDPGVMRLGVLTSSLDHARVDGGLGTIVFMDLVVNIADGLAVGNVGCDICANLSNSAHTGTTSFEDISSGGGRDGGSRESEDGGGSGDLSLSRDHDEYRVNEIKVRLQG
jgi:hypothetical protein